MRERTRYIDIIEEMAFKNGKMAFVSGPRQVGKTTLAKQVLSRRPAGHYFNWDDPSFRRQWIKDPKSLIEEKVGEKTMVVFDEIHKATRWKSTLKGIYDLKGEQATILVTGSAKLDLFRRGGDSLLGRYFPFRMHPFSMGELSNRSVTPDALHAALDRPGLSAPSDLPRLLKFGGFPEPYLKSNEKFSTVWNRTRTERLVREDLIDISRTHEVSLIEATVAMLPERVGSLFSLQSLAEDLEVSHPTAKRWIDWLSQIFYVYRINPYTRMIARSLKKRPKIYLWDWSEIVDDGARFENLVASHLYKAVHFWSDAGMGNFELGYLRDKEKREVDFIILNRRKPWLMIECKRSDRGPSPNLIRFADQLKPEIALQIVETRDVQERFTINRQQKGQVISADRFLPLLP